MSIYPHLTTPYHTFSISVHLTPIITTRAHKYVMYYPYPQGTPLYVGGGF